ncbi:MAG: transcriptional regulator [Nonomuraea muscovyensis]|nr:transcriptional regulator [Nonomuraea muscovyensis]
MDTGRELGDFLRSRRARLRPEDAGLTTYGERRRVAGLRREEVALLAGVSVPYYVRLEQGRAANASDEILDAIARALVLDATERAHLRNLARPRPAARGPAPRVRPTVQRMLDTAGTPAFVLGRRAELLAANRLAAVLFFGGTDAEPDLPAEGLNCARLVFLDPSFRALYRNWEDKARETVAFVRLDAGRHPDDRQLATLIGELSMKSPDFRRMWAEHDVRERSTGKVHLDHPLAGELLLDYETLRVGDDPDQALVTYLAEPGSAAEQALRFLASWAAGSAAAEGSVPGDGQRRGAGVRPGARPRDLARRRAEPQAGQVPGEGGERGAELGAGQRRAQAVVHPVPEHQRRVGAPIRVEPAGVGEVPGVVVGGLQPDEHHVARADRDAGQLHVLLGETGERLAGPP